MPIQNGYFLPKFIVKKIGILEVNKEGTITPIMMSSGQFQPWPSQ
jgi:hypothetical protein